MLIRDPRTALPEIKQTISELGLDKLMATKIVVGNAEMMRKLLLANLYITYGPVTSETIKQMILKRGVVKIGEENIQITGNMIVKKAFENVNNTIECVEDLVDEIAQGNQLDQIFSVLDCFHFTVEKFRNCKHVSVGGVSGYRKNGMDNWILERL